jgi:hypothetical protein
MPIGRLSIRIQPENRLHHIWCNNGTWWIAYVLHFSARKRRIRRSLGTACVEEAIRRRDALLARIEQDGEEVPERRRPRRDDTDEVPTDMGLVLATTA